MPDLNTTELENNADPAEVADLDDRDNADKVADDLVEPSTEEVDIQELKTLHKDITCLYETLDIYESYQSAISEYGASRPVVELMLVHDIHPKKFGLLCDSPETLCSEYDNIGNPHSAESLACLESLSEGIAKMIKWIKEKIKQLIDFSRKLFDKYRLNLERLSRQYYRIQEMLNEYDTSTFSPNADDSTTFPGMSNKEYNTLNDTLLTTTYDEMHHLFNKHFGVENTVSKEECDTIVQKARDLNRATRDKVKKAMSTTTANQVDITRRLKAGEIYIQRAAQQIRDHERHVLNNQKAYKHESDRLKNGSEEEKEQLKAIKADMDYGVLYVEAFEYYNRTLILFGKYNFDTIERRITRCHSKK